MKFKRITNSPEAMDIYNNQVGIDIAEANPDASREELAELIREAIDNGEMVVIDTSTGDLIPSGQG